MPSKVKARFFKRLEKLKNKRLLYALMSLIILSLGGGSLLSCMLCSTVAMHDDPLQGILLVSLDVLISLGIASLLLILYYSFDPYEKEPLGLVSLAFSLGLIVAPLFAIILTVLGSAVISVMPMSQEEIGVLGVTLVAPLVEELIKALCTAAIMFLAWEDVNSPIDGFLYGAVVGLGFSTSENMMYILRGFLKEGVQGFLITLFVRWSIVIFLHQLTTSYVGTSLALAKVSKSWAEKVKHVIGGLAIALLIHFLWNTLSVNFTFMDSQKGIYYTDPQVLIFSTISFFGLYVAGGAPLIASLYRYIKQEEKHILLTLRDLLKELNIPPAIAVAVVNPRVRRALISKLPPEDRGEFKRILRDLAFVSLLLKEESLNPSEKRKELILELLEQIRKRWNDSLSNRLSEGGVA